MCGRRRSLCMHPACILAIICATSTLLHVCRLEVVTQEFCSFIGLNYIDASLALIVVCVLRGAFVAQRQGARPKRVYVITMLPATPHSSRMERFLRYCYCHLQQSLIVICRPILAAYSSFYLPRRDGRQVSPSVPGVEPADPRTRDDDLNRSATPSC